MRGRVGMRARDAIHHELPLPKDVTSEQLFENPHPIPEQDFLDVCVGKSALNQLARQIRRVRMIAQIGDEMRLGQFCGQFAPGRLRPLPINEFEKIEADSHAFAPNQSGDVLDVIDITVEVESSRED